MKLTMSMFATPADYWKARAELAETALADAAAQERQKCIRILEEYCVPVGNSAAGEMAAEWTLAALREIRDQLLAAKTGSIADENTA